MRSLLAAHHRDTRIRPHPELARPVASSAHAVISGPVRSANDHGELRDGSISDRVDHLGAILGDAAMLELFAHDKARDVLQKHQRDVALRAELDEVSRL